MKYIERISFPDQNEEFNFFMGVYRTCYDSYYPFGILSARHLDEIDFAPVTILYGDNGCGKTTALNVIAHKLGLSRQSPINSSSFFTDYADMCTAELSVYTPQTSCAITSDDVFSYILDLRAANGGIDMKREELFADYLAQKRKDFRLESIADYEELKRRNNALFKTQSKYVREYLNNNIREHSNGESAFKYFVEKIEENSLYIFDEPENSLSIARQRQLAQLIEDSARFDGCQFIICTHSLFMLSIKGAKIYDLSEEYAKVKKWTELDIVEKYRDFFREHENDLR